MTEKAKNKKQYPEDFKSIMGFSLPGLSFAFTAVMSSIFMLYLTDYSGIDAAIGQAGYAVEFGTIFLLITRIFDAMYDPIQAFIMDRAKERPFGKYRFFTAIGIIALFIGIVGMFSIPTLIKSSKIFLCVWIFIAYFIFEIGCACNGILPIIQKATLNSKIRTKIMTWHRMFLIIGAVPATLLVPIATAVNTRSKINNMGKAVTLTCVAIVGLATVISLLGIKFLKEPMRNQTEGNTDKITDEKIGFKDVLTLIKINKPMWIHNLAYIIGNSAYGFSGGMIVYFLKWKYFSNPTTGVVDNIGYAASYGIFSVLALVSAFVTPLLAGIFTKKIGTVDKAGRMCLLAGGIIYGLTYLIYLIGGLENPLLLIILLFIANIPMCMATIPFLLISVEVADYAEYMTGKNMSQMTNAVFNFTQKLSAAVNTSIIGIMLLISHYSVNSKTGAYAGNVSQIPGMVNKMALFVALIPAVCALIGWIIYKLFYPINPDFRKIMVKDLEAKHIELSNIEA